MDGLTGAARVLQVHPTRRCNLACAHCYSSSGPDFAGELPIELLRPCLEHAAEMGYRQLAVSGGEPLLYSSLGELLASARALGMLTTLTTNGMLANPARWEPLASHVDMVAVSIDGREQEHDLIRRRKGAYARTVANLETIRASGVPFGLIFTLTQHNVDGLESVVRLAARTGARSVQVHPLTLHGRAGSEMRESRPDGFELVAALFEASRLGNELGVAVHVDALLGEQLESFHAALVPGPLAQLADAAPILVIESDSTVMPLTHEVSRDLALGRLLDSDLRSLARAWLTDGRADRLALACERTWRELTRADTVSAVYWYDEVAARTFAPRIPVRSVTPLRA
jgi:Fe-coproporphyrin III synthase